MPTRVYISLLILLFTFFVLGASSVVAQQYTTQGRSSAVSNTQTSSSSPRSASGPSSKTNAEKCTIQDAKAIQKFDRKAMRNIKIASEGKEYQKQASGADQKHAQKRVQAMEFFVSEEYEKMKPVYLRCGRTMPTYNPISPYWMPEDTDAACPTCGK